MSKKGMTYQVAARIQSPADENKIIPIRNKATTLKSVKRAVKQRTKGRVGELAVYEVMLSVESFLDLLVERATDNLEEENEHRKKVGLEVRKTLQEIDIRKAKNAILIQYL